MSLSLLISLGLLWTAPAQAQLLPVGLFEGLMANSGVALSESKAPSFYNPSLLRQRKENAFSANGNTLGTVNSKDGDTTLSSSINLSPTYLSSTLVGDSLVHEFFMANTLQGQFSLRSENSTEKLDADSNINRVVAGYSMAFKSIPLALQFLARYSEVRLFGFSEPVSTSPPVSLAKVQSDYKNLNLALGLSTHLQFDHYTLGVNFNSRGWTLYNKQEGTARNFTYGSPSPTDVTITEESSRSKISHEESRLSVGHSFRLGNHELLTDSVFSEESEALGSYKFHQTFGYKYGPSDGHQLLCGVHHRFGSDVSYFGQNIGTSVGYSWMTRELRSAIGLYYGRDNTQIESSTVGIVFGSEYEY